MLVQMDGSHHPWLGNHVPPFTLLIAIDDASGAVAGALFCEKEDAHGYFLLIQGLVRYLGIPVAFYTDRHGVFRHTPGSGLPGMPTQFSRAMDEQGIQMIFALSPQAKGRVERVAGTFQDRLVTELRLSGAGSIGEANSVLEQFLPRFNHRFEVPPLYPESAFRPLGPELGLEQILCFKQRRTVARDNTVRFQLHTLQLLPGADAPAMPVRLWRSSKDWTAGSRCGTKGASSLPRRRHPVRCFSETATGVLHLFLSCPPTPTAWGNNGGRASNHWTQEQRMRRIRSMSLTALPPPASPQPPLRASRRSFRRRDGRRFRKPGSRGCRCERSSGNWESTEPPSRNTSTPRVLQRGDPGRVPPRQHLIPWRHKRVTFILDSDTPLAQLPAALDSS